MQKTYTFLTTKVQTYNVRMDFVLETYELSLFGKKIMQLTIYYIRLT